VATDEDVKRAFDELKQKTSHALFDRAIWNSRYYAAFEKTRPAIEERFFMPILAILFFSLVLMIQKCYHKIIVEICHIFVAYTKISQQLFTIVEKQFPKNCNKTWIC
jgi:hypothetical protein